MRSAIVLVALVVVVAALPAPAPAADAPPWSPGRNDYRVAAGDGVLLDVVMWVPAGTPSDAALPAVVIGHGYGGSKDAGSARLAAERGYVGFAWSARGFGESGGRMDVVGPRSVQDLVELVAWLKATGPVDAARVGYYGASYGGGHAMQIATREDAGLATVVAAATWSDLHHALVPNGVEKFSYTLGFYAGGMGLVQDGDEPTRQDVAGENLGRRCLCDTYHPDVHRWFVEGALDVADDDVAQGLRERSAIHRAANVRVPFFMIQGMNDDLFSAEQALEMFDRVATPDKRLYLGYVGHPRAVASGPEVDWVVGEVFAWFDHFLRGEGPSPTTGVVEVGSSPWDGTVLALPRWTRGEEGARFALTADGALARGDAGAASFLGVANTYAAGVPDDAAADHVLDWTSEAPAGTAADTLVFRSGPLEAPATLLGTPRAELVVRTTAREHMVAVKVFDRAPDGRATLVTRGVYGVEDALPGVEQRLVFDLQPYHHTFAAGHEVEVRVAASDFPAYLPVRTPFATLVAVGEGGSAVRLPFA